MGIRIDSILRREFAPHFSWHLRAKGFEGQGIYFSCWTGVDGAGLYASRDMTDEPRELLGPARFCVHAECTAEQVVHRVVTALVSIGWGPEYIVDRDAISGGRRFDCQVVVAKGPYDPRTALL